MSTVTYTGIDATLSYNTDTGPIIMNLMWKKSHQNCYCCCFCCYRYSIHNYTQFENNQCTNVLMVIIDESQTNKQTKIVQMFPYQHNRRFIILGTYYYYVLKKKNSFKIQIEI